MARTAPNRPRKLLHLELAQSYYDLAELARKNEATDLVYETPRRDMTRPPTRRGGAVSGNAKMDWTKHTSRNERLARLLKGARTYEPEDLASNSELSAEIAVALATPPSDQPLERELYDLLARTVQAPDTVETYDLDRALAEAEGMVAPGGAIEYQYRWRAPDGDWSPWITWRTRDDMDVALPEPAGDAQFRITAAPARH